MNASGTATTMKCGANAKVTHSRSPSVTALPKTISFSCKSCTTTRSCKIASSPTASGQRISRSTTRSYSDINPLRASPSSPTLDQRRVIQVGETVGCAGLHQLRRARGLRQRDAQLARSGQGEAQVLLVQLDAKARIEGALDHPLAVHFEDARGREAAHQRRAHLRRIGAGLAGEDQGLAHRRDVQRDDDLIGYFAGLSVAVLADEGDVLAHQFEERLHPGKAFAGAADHDGERGGLGAHFSAGDRRVEILAAERVDL